MLPATIPAETAVILRSPGRLLLPPPPPPPPGRWSGETDRKLRGDGERHGKNTCFLSALEQQQDGAGAFKLKLRWCIRGEEWRMARGGGGLG